MESGHLVFLCLLSFFAAEQGRLRRRRRRQSNTIPTPKVALLYSPTFILYEMAVKASVTELVSNFAFTTLLFEKDVGDLLFLL